MNETIGEVIERMERAGQGLSGPATFFHETYLRTTVAVAEVVAAGEFVDGEWVERWDAAFASLYLDALEAWLSKGEAPAPWSVAFSAWTGPRLPPLRHVLLGMNAHINYDLPQALLAVIDDAGFVDFDLLDRRSEDHRRVDGILAGRVAAEDHEMRRFELPGDRTLLDRLLTPFNRLGTKRFLRESREKVWANAVTLAAARRSDTLDAELRRLSELTTARVRDLLRPGQVIGELAIRGFGVRL